MSNLQKIVVLCVVGCIILVGGFFLLSNNNYNEKQTDEVKTILPQDNTVKTEEETDDKDILEERSIVEVENEKVTLVISGYGYEIGDIVEIDSTKTPQVGDTVLYDANANKSYCFAFGPGVDLAKITGVPGTQVLFGESSFTVNGEGFSIENNRMVPFLFGNQKHESIPSNNLVIAQGEFMGDKWIGQECPGEVNETGTSVAYNRFTVQAQAIKGVIIRKLGHDSEFAEERKNIVY